MSEDCIDAGEKKRITRQAYQRWAVRRFGRMRVDMLFENVPRHLRIDLTVTGLIIRQQARNRNAKAKRRSQQQRECEHSIPLVPHCRVALHDCASTVALRSSFPQPTVLPRVATATDLIMT